MSGTDEYFCLHHQIEEAVRNGKYEEVARLAKRAIALFSVLVRETKRKYGQFDIQESVAVKTGGEVMAALGDRDGLVALRSGLLRIPELQGWAQTVDRFEADLDLGQRIVEIVSESPGFAQLDLKRALGIEDGRRISNVTYWLEKVGRLTREKAGRSYNLYPAQ